MLSVYSQTPTTFIIFIVSKTNKAALNLSVLLPRRCPFTPDPKQPTVYYSGLSYDWNNTMCGPLHPAFFT